MLQSSDCFFGWALKHDFLLKFLFLQGSCISWKKLQVVFIGVSCLKTNYAYQTIQPHRQWCATSRTTWWWCSFANVYRPVTLEHISEHDVDPRDMLLLIFFGP